MSYTSHHRADGPDDRRPGGHGRRRRAKSSGGLFSGILNARGSARSDGPAGSQHRESHSHASGGYPQGGYQQDTALAAGHEGPGEQGRGFNPFRKGDGGPRKPKKTGWRRFVPSWKLTLGLFGLGILAMISLFGLIYKLTPMPDPNSQALAQSSAIYFTKSGDAKSGGQIARVGEVNRQEVKAIDDVPKHVRDAVLAAENRNFYSDPGVSPTGLARAMWGAARGGDAGGGSTITQQLAKNYYLTSERSMKRKFKELFISVKVEKRWSKDEILRNYLNTIYFGRDSYGIQAASKAYFNKDVGRLTEAEGAYLAGIIQLPEYYGTKGESKAETKEIAQKTLTRYQYVVDGMTGMKAIDPGKAASIKAKLPKTVKTNDDAMLGGQNGYIRDRVLAELKNKYGITKQALTRNPLKITTTFDQKMTNDLAQTVRKYKRERGLKGKGVQFGVATVNPKNGEVVAAYGGPNYPDHGWDNAYQSRLQPGSSFKPYVLAAALKQGYGLKSTLDGDTPQNIGGTTYHNTTPREKGVYDLVKATQQSINTAYVRLGRTAGLPKVREAAVAAGIPKGSEGLDKDEFGLSLGTALVRPVDQAEGYATFANGGQHIDAHVIQKIENADGTPFKKVAPDQNRAFESDVAADATYAMQQVLRSPGTGRKAAFTDGRPAAGKTGTTSENKAAWFVGYTPQYSTSVAMYRERKTKQGAVTVPLTGIGGYTEVHGGDAPAELWNRFMTQAHEGKPHEPFPPPVFGGTIKQWATPSPTTSSTPSPTQSCLRGQPCPPTPNPTNTCGPSGQQPCPGIPSGTPTCEPPLCPGPHDGDGRRDDDRQPASGEPPRPRYQSRPQD